MIIEPDETVWNPHYKKEQTPNPKPEPLNPKQTLNPKSVSKQNPRNLKKKNRGLCPGRGQPHPCPNLSPVFTQKDPICNGILGTLNPKPLKTVGFQ